jgi:predicted GNAT family acetyltransferase
MVCTAATYRPAPKAAGLTITELTQASAVQQAQEFLATQRRGFDVDDTTAATEGEGEQFLRMLGEGHAFVAWLKGRPVGAGMVMAPLDGVTEIAGLATLAPFRNRGIATALAALAVRRALDQGAEVVCLTAADERAGRVYERVGFARCATMLAYVDSPEETPDVASIS